MSINIDLSIYWICILAYLIFLVVRQMNSLDLITKRTITRTADPSGIHGVSGSLESD